MKSNNKTNEPIRCAQCDEIVSFVPPEHDSYYFCDPFCTELFMVGESFDHESEVIEYY